MGPNQAQTLLTGTEDKTRLMALISLLLLLFAVCGEQRRAQSMLDCTMPIHKHAIKTTEHKPGLRKSFAWVQPHHNTAAV